ncbi:MAG: hypothetical protein Q8L16_06125 [Hydrogenophaga sp.]|nr:hypothetical protein [Hydrogenophaga sp.]
MKSPDRSILLPILTGVIALAGASAVQAQDERARVLSSKPIIQQVATPREVCQNQTVTVPGHKSGAGALIGGIAGGAMGNAIGGGSGRAVATAIGLFGGAVLGNHIEGRGQPRTQTVQQCSTQTFYENQTVAYDVVYEYAGRRYNVQMPEEPGRYVHVNVQPVIAAPAPRQQMQYRPALPAEPEVIYIGGTRPYPEGYRGNRWDRDNEQWDRNWR